MSEGSKDQAMMIEKDPVCGMDVDPKAAAGSATYRGRTYYFCSTHCRDAFNAEPQKYVRAS